MNLISKWLKGFEIENCQVCTTRIDILLHPVQGYCKHSTSHYSENACYKFSFWSALLLVAGMVFFVPGIIRQIEDTEYCARKEIECLPTLSNIIYSTFALYNCFDLIIRRKLFLNALNAWCSLLDRYRYLGPLITTETCKRHNVITIFLRVFGVTLQIGYFSTEMYQLLQQDKWYPFTPLLGRITAFVALMIQPIFVFTYCRYITLYRNMNKRQMEYLAEVMMLKRGTVLYMPIGRIFQSHIKLILTDRYMLRHLTAYYNYIGIIWIVAATSSLIINIYSLFVISLGALGYILLAWKTCILVVLLIYWVVHVDMANINDDIMSFMFQYPVSKLTKIEAAQLEMLIKTLIIEKPLVKASDLVTINAQLLASVSSTVLTYVLVGLQFRSFWSKN